MTRRHRAKGVVRDQSDNPSHARAYPYGGPEVGTVYWNWHEARFDRVIELRINRDVHPAVRYAYSEAVNPL